MGERQRPARQCDVAGLQVDSAATVSGPRAMSTAVADTGFVLSTVQCSIPDGADVAAIAVAVMASTAIAAAASSAAVRLMFKVPPGLGMPRSCGAGVGVVEVMSGSTRSVVTGGQASEPQ